MNLRSWSAIAGLAIGLTTACGTAAGATGAAAPKRSPSIAPQVAAYRHALDTGWSNDSNGTYVFGQACDTSLRPFPSGKCSQWAQSDQVNQRNFLTLLARSTAPSSLTAQDASLRGLLQKLIADDVALGKAADNSDLAQVDKLADTIDQDNHDLGLLLRRMNPQLASSCPC